MNFRSSRNGPLTAFARFTILGHTKQPVTICLSTGQRSRSGSHSCFLSQSTCPPLQYTRSRASPSMTYSNRLSPSCYRVSPSLMRMPNKNPVCHFMTWNGRSQSPVSDDGLSDGHEEAARAAILEKALKGRQPTDLLLRCEFNCFSIYCFSVVVKTCYVLTLVLFLPFPGTILDANGKSSTISF